MEKPIKEDCFLTPEAEEVVREFEICGLDRDLAIEIVARTWPEKAVWRLDGPN